MSDVLTGPGGPRPGASGGDRDPRPAVAEPARRARLAAVAAGVGTTLPVFVDRAGGGVIVDVDGNSLIDLGSGIAVRQRRQRGARASSRAVQEQVAAFTHTCFMVTPYEGYVEVCEAARPAHAGRPRQEVGAVQLRRRGRRERGQDRPARHRPRTRSSSSTTPTTAAPTSRWR